MKQSPGRSSGSPDSNAPTGPQKSRQPAGFPPKPSRGSAPVTVEIQRHNRGSADPGDADDYLSVLRPPEVFAPDVIARMKERDFATSQRIGPLSFVCLCEIARCASQGTIREGIRPFARRGNDMVHVKTIAAYGLGRMAVLAAVARPHLDASPKLLRGGHPALSLSCQFLGSFPCDADNCCRSRASFRAFPSVISSASSTRACNS
jgi:hypothetical protein